MTEYVLACTKYMHHINASCNLGVKGMESPLWQIEGITSGTHSTPEQLRLPFHTSKCCQSTVHHMCIKNMVELSRSPSTSMFCTLIGPIRKTQLILQVLPYPLSQLRWQPPQGLMCRPVDVLQPLWRGCMCMQHDQYGNRLISKVKPAWLQKVDVQHHITRAISRTSLFSPTLLEYILR